MTIGIKKSSEYYIDLFITFPPRPIVTKTDLIATQQRINSLLDKGDLTQDDRDYLRVLGMLVYEYEEKHEMIPTLKDGELLQALMEEFNLQTQDFLHIFQTEARISAILAGQGEINSQESEKLARFYL